MKSFQAIQHGFIEGKPLFTDSTFLKANASKSKYKKQKVTVTPKDYVEQLEKALGKNPLKKNESSLKKEKSE